MLFLMRLWMMWAFGNNYGPYVPFSWALPPSCRISQEIFSQLAAQQWTCTGRLDTRAQCHSAMPALCASYSVNKEQSSAPAGAVSLKSGPPVPWWPHHLPDPIGPPDREVCETICACLPGGQFHLSNKHCGFFCTIAAAKNRSGFPLLLFWSTYLSLPSSLHLFVCSILLYSTVTATAPPSSWEMQLHVLFSGVLSLLFLCSFSVVSLFFSSPCSTEEDIFTRIHSLVTVRSHLGFHKL